MDKSVIALVGPSGSGKSSIGFALSLRLKWNFLDTDTEIEGLTGQSVADIFRNLGEAAFRAKEFQLVEDLALTDKSKNLVLATGGGLPVFADNWEKLESFATIVYLTAPLEVLVTRIMSSQRRPLLAGAAADHESIEDGELGIRLGKLIAERKNFYERARYKIDTSGTDVEQLADVIIRLTGLVIPPG